MAAPGEPIVELLFQDIDATLRTITVANGYFTTLNTVTRGDMSPLEQFGLPFASILPVSDLPEYGPGVLRRVLTFTTRLWIDDALASAATTLQHLIRDVQAALVVDQHRSGLAQVTLETGVDYLYLVDKSRLCGADVHWQVTYLTDLFNPSQEL